MKKWINKFVFGTFLFVMTLVTAISVNALTIRETTNLNDNYDSIADGTVIIGITKFEPNVVITALRASNATFNDVIFNYGTPGYKGVEIFYLLSGDWYNIDEENDANLVEDTTLLEKLNTSDIFYINNNEKMIEIPYSKTLEDGFEFIFYADNIEKNDEIILENGKLKVPATVKEVDVYVKETATGNEDKLDHFEKDDITDAEFERTSSDGVISKGDATGGDLTYVVNGNTITIDGTIDWYRSDATAQNGRPAGNYASVKISAPEVYSESELLANAKVKIDDRAVIDWDTITDAALNEDTFFVFYPKFDEETTSHTITIEWLNGNTQVFTIELAETATLEDGAKGTISWDPGYTGGSDLDVNVTGNKITFDGAIAWYRGDATLGRTAGNRVGVQITAPELYTASEIASATVKIGNNTYAWGDILDGTNYFWFYPTFDAETTSSTVTIEWENGNTQVFTIELAETATLDEPAKGTIVKGDTTGGDLTYVVSGNKITIDGTIDWYRSDATAQNGRPAGNYASVKISAPAIYTETELLTNATVKIDNRAIIDWDTITDDALNEDTFFVFYPKFDEETTSHTITIKWEDGNTQVFTIELAETVTLENPAKGTISWDPGYTGGSDLDVNVTGNKITFDGAIAWYKGDATLGRTAGNRVGVQITAPELYTAGEIATATVKIGNNTYAWGDILDGTNYFWFYPKFDAETTSSTVTIEWEDGNTQVFTIELAETATLDEPAKGTIAKGGTTGGDLTYVVDNNKITINGDVEWYSADATAQNGRPAGNYASVKISAPAIYTETELLTNATVKIDNRAIVNWDIITDDALNEDTFFVFYPKFDAETTSHTITIKWEDGHTQVFTIELAETATLQLPPQGTIVKGDATGGDLTYVVDGNKITINGEIDWYKADANAQNGRPAGNYASVKISANDVYAEADLLANATVKIDGRVAVDWGAVTDDELNEDTFFVFYPRFDAETTSHTITIEWEDGNTQVFTIELAETATLGDPTRGTIAKGDTTGGDLTYVVDNNEITINGDVEWYSADATAQNGRPAGNYASVKISAPAIYTETELLTNATVKIDNRTIIDWDTITDNALNEDTFFVFYPKFDAETTSHTITIEWEDGNTQVFTIELAETATLQLPPQGTISWDPGYTGGDNLDVVVDKNKITFDGAIEWYRSDDGLGRTAGNRVGVQITAPELYTAGEIATATVKIGNNTYAWGDILDGTNYFWFYPKFDAETTSSTVEITWEDGNIQVFTIELAETATLDSEPSVYTESVSLNKDTTDIIIGQSEQLVATVLPEEATNKNVKWTSSDTSIATVNATGQVTAVAYGTATITVTTLDGKFTDTCEVSSVYRPINTPSVSMNSSVVEMAGLFSRQVTPTLNVTGGSGSYTYHFAIYNASTGVKFADTESAELDPNSNGFTLTIRSKTLAYRVDYIITDSVGNTKSGSFNIDAYES